MKRNIRGLVFGGAAGLILAGAAAVAVAEDDQKVELNALPPAVLATAEANAQGGKLTEAELETEDGKQVYSIEVKKADGKELEIEIAADGKLIEVEEEDDDEAEGKDEEVKIEVAQAPAPVQAALGKFLKEGATSVTLVREKEHGVELYEAEYFVAGVEHSLKLGANGAVIELENVTEASALPAEVTAAIQKKFPGAQVSEAEEVTLHFFELEIKAGGKTREVKVSPDGSLMGDDDDDDDDDDK